MSKIVTALIVAAGTGERFGSAVPKQYALLAGKPILRWSVEQFRCHPRVGNVVVVIQPGHRSLYDDAVAGLDLPEPVDGGSTRQESVRRGLEALQCYAPRLVLIHDAARPLVTAAIVDEVCNGLDQQAGTIPALSVTDTLHRGNGATLDMPVGRNGLWRAQTPQGFVFSDILAAHRSAACVAMTDDAAVARHAGISVGVVRGSEDNFKVTTVEDLARAERVLAVGQVDIRTGLGFDVHRFATGDRLVLCGVSIPHERGLEGHSDADVGLHALTDALLGAIGAGDIGMHFPPTDPRWRAADSALFLRHAASLVAARGGAIASADVTLICESPKIGPHRIAMTARVSELLGVALDRVSVKATTTEQLGFTGRREGIAAQAVATVRLPMSAR